MDTFFGDVKKNPEFRRQHSQFSALCLLGDDLATFLEVFAWTCHRHPQTMVLRTAERMQSKKWRIYYFVEHDVFVHHYTYIVCCFQVMPKICCSIVFFKKKLGCKVVCHFFKDLRPQTSQFHKYPLVMTNSLLLKMALEIEDFPIQNGGSFHKKPSFCWLKPPGVRILNLKFTEILLDSRFFMSIIKI